MGIFSRLRDMVSRSFDRNSKSDPSRLIQAREASFSPAQVGDNTDPPYALSAIRAQARNGTEIDDGMDFYRQYRARGGWDRAQAVREALEDLVQQQRLDDGHVGSGGAVDREMESMTHEQAPAAG
jgi:hypothetical protein